METEEIIEIVAPTQEEAQQQALARLGLSSPEELEILEVEKVEPSHWLERLAGRSQVRLRARRRPSASLQALQHLQILLAHWGLGLQAHLLQETPKEVHINLEGSREELAPLIGSYGHTLDALQFLLNLMLHHQGHRKRVLLDADGYRERRRRRLEALARACALRAKRTGKEVVLPSLTASERKVIHTTLQHHPDVITFSEGEEPHRRLIIAPRRPKPSR